MLHRLIEGKSLSVMPRPGTRMIRADAARSVGIRGLTQSRNACCSRSGAKLRSGRSGWDNVRFSPFDSKAALEDWVRDTRARGSESIDVGCMQVNQKWHARQFASLAEATDPTANVDYAARFLRALYAETRDWWEAAGRYHSSTPDLKAIYLGKLQQNQRLANSDVLQARGDAPLTIVRPAQPSVNWSADMTGSGAQVMRQVVSIYTPTPLQPILPNYQRQD